MILLSLLILSDRVLLIFPANIIEFYFKKLPREQPKDEQTETFEDSSLLMCSAMCGRRDECQGFGFIEPPENKCYLYEYDKMQYGAKENENYNYFIKLPEPKDEEDPPAEKKDIVKPNAEKKNWIEANAYCGLYHRGTLPVISNEQEQKEIEDFISNDAAFNDVEAIWLGLHSLYTITDEGEFFLWSTEKPLEPGYTNWAQNEPHGGTGDKEQCVIMYTAKNGKDMLGKWADTECLPGNEFPFICQDNNQELVHLMGQSAFDKSKEACDKDLGWRLVVIPDEDTQNKIESFLGEFRKTDKWIGLWTTEKGKETWSDGRKLSDTRYSEWDKDQPKEYFGEETCTVITENMLWQTFPCRSPNYPKAAEAICEHIP